MWIVFKIKFSRCLQIFYITQMFCEIWVKINICCFLEIYFLGDNLRKMECINIITPPPFCLFFIFFYFACLFWPTRKRQLSTLGVYLGPSITAFHIHCFQTSKTAISSCSGLESHTDSSLRQVSQKVIVFFKVKLLIPVTQNPHTKMRSDEGPQGPDRHVT